MLDGKSTRFKIAAPRGFALWWRAIRPRTLALSINPVIAGTTFAWASGGPVAHPEAGLVAALSATAIQAGTNLINDAADYLNGTDRIERFGPTRITERGWATPRQVLAAGYLAFGLAVLGGLYLAWLGGWVIVGLGLASLAAGYGYSRGPWPLSRTPFGEVFVILFFGIAAVAGTYYVHGLPPTATVYAWGLLVGLPAAAVLLVNNTRDSLSDSRAGRRTLAIRIGLPGARRIYGGLMLAPFGGLAALTWSGLMPVSALLGLIALPPAAVAVRRFRRTSPGPGLNALLGHSAAVQALLVAATGLGLLLGLAGDRYGMW